MYIHLKGFTDRKTIKAFNDIHLSTDPTPGCLYPSRRRGSINIGV